MDKLFPSTYYHIFNHANGKDNLFQEQENYRYFLQQYYKNISSIADTYCYCLMPNHFHLLVRIKSEEAITAHHPGFKNLDGVAVPNFLSQQFSNFFNGYSKAFNKKFNRRGSLFLKNFKRTAIVQKDYLCSAILYIHLNAVKHGFTANPANWNWSSYHHFHLERSPLVNDLFESEEGYFKMHEKRIEQYSEYEKLERYFID